MQATLVVLLTEMATKVLVPAILAWLGLQGSRWLKAKTGNEALSGAMVRLADAVNTAVGELQQTIVNGLKERAADGKLSAEDVEQVKRLALAKVVAYLGEHGLEALARQLDMDDHGISALIGAKIEAAVLSMKSPAATPTLPPFLAGPPPIPPVPQVKPGLPPFLAGNPR